MCLIPFETLTTINVFPSSKRSSELTSSCGFGSICVVMISDIFLKVSSILSTPTIVPSSLTPMTIVPPEAFKNETISLQMIFF